MMRNDFMDQCNPGLKVTIKLFEDQICHNGCVNPLCRRSGYKDDATQQKIEHREKLREFKDPEQQDVSPLSEWPESIGIHKAQVPSEISEGTEHNQSVQDLKNVMANLRKDPWEVSGKRGVVDIYKEYENPEQDPWNPKYKGSKVIDRKASPGETIKMPGSRAKNG